MALRVLTPSSNTGHNTVGAPSFRSGMVAALNGDGAVVVCGGADDPSNGAKPIGLFGDDRLGTILQQTSQVEESVIVTIGTGIALAHDSIVAGSYVLRRGLTVLTEGVGQDYTIVTSTGVVTFLAGGPAGLVNGDVVLVTYTFQLDDDAEKDFRGVDYRGSLDDTAGSKKVTVWKGHGEFYTDQYVTSQAYSVGALLRVTRSAHPMGAGLLTPEAAGPQVGATATARVFKVPTAADPLLGFEWIPVAA